MLRTLLTLAPTEGLTSMYVTSPADSIFLKDGICMRPAIVKAIAEGLGERSGVFAEWFQSC